MTVGDVVVLPDMQCGVQLNAVNLEFVTSYKRAFNITRERVRSMLANDQRIGHLTINYCSECLLPLLLLLIRRAQLMIKKLCLVSLAAGNHFNYYDCTWTRTSINKQRTFSALPYKYSSFQI